MKIRYHKIPGVDLETCAAEQMLAYNVAFRVRISFCDIYKRMKAEGKARAVILDELNDWKRINLDELKRQLDKKGRSAWIDGVQGCLNAGLEAYLDHPFIASDYKEVGKAFPALYA